MVSLLLLLFQNNLPKAKLTREVFPRPNNEQNSSCSFPFKAVQITTYSLLMASSVIGNFLVVGVFYRNKTLRTAAYYFIMNMAVSDLLYSLFYLPFCIVTTLTKSILTMFG